MTRDEAQELCERLAREHPDRETHTWFPRQKPDGAWSVAKLARAPEKGVDPLTATVEARPRPPHADDPRDLHTRHRPGY